MAEPIHDPEQYQRASVPFETAKAADEAITAFWNEVYELRKKHNIANVTVIIRDAIQGSGDCLWSGHIGDPEKQESMAAWHFGQASAERQDMVRRAVRSGVENAIKTAKSMLSDDD